MTAYGGNFDIARRRVSFAEKVWGINWGLLILLTVIAGVGFMTLYSASSGSLQPWAAKQMVRYGISVALMIGTALIDIRFWYRSAYVIYGVVLVLLVAVEIRGETGMGATRWIDLGIIQLQPSELMKVAAVMVLARHFHVLSVEEIGRPLRLVFPAVLVFAPVVLVLKQPDLGTAMMVVMSGGALFFLAGVRIWKFAVLIAAVGAALPLAWGHLREYQKNRIYTFLNPENDPLGTGYHILQSKIALGSGGVFGKGYLDGTQSHLSFLPEKHTDFIFTMFAEEWGLVGGLVLLGLYTLVFAYGYAIALRSRNHFGRLLAFGVTINFFLYVFVNTGMVMGLLPVVGVPLPLISYGGTSMLSVMFAFGLMMSVYIHRDTTIGRRGETTDE
jgi:rod shape determining protein RodA